jgi:DNA (cytosine-5)-methyltransferase 1
MAWHPLGWTPAFFSEIDKFPSAVLAHHYGSNMPDEPATANGVPNYGDMTEFERWPDDAIDILVGGTPCQDYSIAGLRAGMAGDRGSLTLTYIQIAARYRPTWIVWENVPGVLSSNKGRDFARFLGDLSGTKVEVPSEGWKTGGIVAGDPNAYGLAYRVIDTQFVRVDGFGRAIPQRRRRVFVIGYLGDWRRAAAVLLEPESLSGDTPPRREAGKGLAGGTLRSTDGGCDVDHARANHLVSEAWPASVPPTLNAAFGDKQGLEDQHALNGAGLFVPFTKQAIGEYDDLNVSSTDSARDYKDATDLVAHSLRGEGFDASEDGTGRATPLVPVAFNSREDTEVTHDRTGPLGASLPQAQAIANSAAVRRLTPKEVERLQGFPDGFTQIPWRKKTVDQCPDGPRYKALGNSMSVNVMRWIGRRIEMVSKL